MASNNQSVQSVPLDMYLAPRPITAFIRGFWESAGLQLLYSSYSSFFSPSSVSFVAFILDSRLLNQLKAERSLSWDVLGIDAQKCRKCPLHRIHDIIAGGRWHECVLGCGRCHTCGASWQRGVCRRWLLLLSFWPVFPRLHRRYIRHQRHLTGRKETHMSVSKSLDKKHVFTAHNGTDVVSRSQWECSWVVTASFHRYELGVLLNCN